MDRRQFLKHLLGGTAVVAGTAVLIKKEGLKIEYKTKLDQGAKKRTPRPDWYTMGSDPFILSTMTGPTFTICGYVYDGPSDKCRTCPERESCASRKWRENGGLRVDYKTRVL